MNDPQQNPNAAGPVVEDDEDGGSVSIVTEFVWFIQENKKWWLIPIIVGCLVLAGIVFVSSNPAAAPFLYSLF
jgi:hypothetical protein